MHAAVTAEPLVLPPRFRAVALDAGVPFAVAAAQAGEAGAGALFWALRPGSLGFAVVLEPETPLAAARGVFPVAMAALADALAAHCAPERSVAIAWPGTLVCDTGRLGGGRLAWPAGAAEAAPPDWLVFGADLIADRDDVPETGVHPGSTSLKEEGVEAPLAVVESFARHLMLHLDTWEVRGHGAACEGYLQRLAGLPAGARLRIAPGGDLELAGEAGVSRRSLVAGLAAADWWDAGRGGVRL